MLSKLWVLFIRCLDNVLNPNHDDESAFGVYQFWSFGELLPSARIGDTDLL